MIINENDEMTQYHPNLAFYKYLMREKTILWKSSNSISEKAQIRKNGILKNIEI